MQWFRQQLQVLCRPDHSSSHGIQQVPRKNWQDLDRYRTGQHPYSVCNRWNYGASGNQAQAKKMIAAAKASGFNFGIYCSPLSRQANGPIYLDPTASISTPLCRCGSLPGTVMTAVSQWAPNLGGGQLPLACSTLARRACRLRVTSTLISSGVIFVKIGAPRLSL